MSDDVLDLRDLLSKPGSDFPDLPDLPPAKTFFGKLLGVTADHSSVKKTPFFRFDIRLTDPGADVTEADLKPVKEGGFSLADYTFNADFYLTPNAMKMLRRFNDSLGFPSNVPIAELMKLDDNCNPTQETQELYRGRDVIVRTGPKDDKGRVYNRADSCAGTKRE